jgi:hypothetical protein
MHFENLIHEGFEDLSAMLEEGALSRS